MRLIEADKVVPLCRLLICGWDNGIADNIAKGLQEVVDIHTIEAEPVRHGRWIDARESYKDVPSCECSECGRRIFGLESNYNYCPNCGCKMDKAE